MKYEMKLRPHPYHMIRFGTKTVELRLYDKKRRQIQVGDTIVFSNTEIPEMQLRTEVAALHNFPTFADLFESLPINTCGFAPETTVREAVTEMRQYYSEEQEAKYGVLGIEIRLVDEENDWTKHCSNSSVDTAGFIRRLERMKQGGSSLCPFCGGTVKMQLNENRRTVFACDTCDMRIEFENR